MTKLSPRVQSLSHDISLRLHRSLLSIGLLFAFSCVQAALPASVSNYLTLPDTPFNYSQINFPAHFNPALGALDNTPANPAPSDDIATLGRVLFYEEELSANGTVACASCHLQANGFSDPDQFSQGFEGGRTPRNSMGLANSRFYENGHFFWDERANTLADQTLTPIQDPVEMGLTLAQAVANISGQPYYDYLFTQAFGSSTVTTGRIATALSQFVRAIVSYQASYDVGLAATGDRQAPFPNYTAAENAGKNLFFSGRTQCGNCHMNGRGGNQAVFLPDQPRNNGLDAALVNSDNGLGDITGNINDNGKFKVPSLRNIALTAPYMHDGRFATLEQVIEHYNSGVENHPNLDPRLRVGGGQVRRLNLTNAERVNLLAFLQTLTDTSLINDTRFSDPFRDSPLNNGGVMPAILMLLLDD